MAHGGFVPSVWWIAPFAALLVTVAAIPMVAPAFWHSNSRKLVVSALFGAPVMVLYARNAPLALLFTLQDYVSFTILLGSLFVVSGGVLMDGDLAATPSVNTLFLAAGTVLASFIGTTGASMLLIRPLLHTNSQRTRVMHTVVFFIFLVSNIGGALTPLGDPPLFLGYLQGVPFSWTLRLFPHWLFTCGFLLLAFFLCDRWQCRREPARNLELDRAIRKPVRVTGIHNLVLLVVVVAAVAWLAAPWREAALIAISAISWVTTSHHIRHANRFTFHPILEVAAVFAGVFLTMVPALDLLRVHGPLLGVREPWQFFWATGTLSSLLDNAPTYLAFLALAQGLQLPPEVVGVPHRLLEAISTGAVFMGALSYLGNGPNFMVRSIAEARGVRMPSFGGYLLFSAAVLLPTFLIVTLVFFR